MSVVTAATLQLKCGFFLFRFPRVLVVSSFSALVHFIGVRLIVLVWAVWTVHLRGEVSEQLPRNAFQFPDGTEQVDVTSSIHKEARARNNPNKPNNPGHKWIELNADAPAHRNACMHLFTRERKEK